ncbi:hypothetical protein THF1C08_940002 [Vibrio jasicida]|nr:hypothetical protein THF1C08_940002 [Vibrio jasicida]
MIIKKLKQSYSVKTLCEVFNVHRSSYNYWHKRPTVINAEAVKLAAWLARLTPQAMAQREREPLQI